jgi:hypothetical protein
VPVDRRMPRVQAVVLPLLRAGLTDWNPTVAADPKIGTWVEGTKQRHFPLINIRRLAGPNSGDVELLDLPVIEMTAYAGGELAVAEDLYLDARLVLSRAVRNQTVVPNVGYLHSFFETMGPIQLDSPYDDTWRIQGLIQLGLRPVRS